MKKIIIIYLAFVVAVFAQSKVGSTASPFLNIGNGARAIGMGSAFTGTANDISALYWNPAGASRVGTNSAMFTQSNWIADIKYNWVAGMMDIGDLGTIGVSLTYLDYGDMEITTMSDQEGTGQYFSAHDMAFGITYAANLTDRFSIGGSVKYIENKIWEVSASTVAFDLGILFYSDFAGIRLGATITNLGPDMQLNGKNLFIEHDIDPNNYGNNSRILARWETDQFPLPLTFKIGLASDILDIEDHKFTLAADIMHPNDNDEYVNLGAEYQMFNILSLRGGYKSLFLDNSEEGLTLGFGLKYDIADNLGVYFDYAYQDVKVFGNAQHFSLGINF